LTAGKTVDGFPVTSFNFLPVIDPTINLWSRNKTIKVDVWGDYWFNYAHGKYRQVVKWKGKTYTVDDYDWFTCVIRDWVRGSSEAEADRPGIYRQEMTKEAAIDLYFGIMEGN
jgi:hypothetical protein